jgi:protein-L-isoaspartate(D-aspartate) O-methyltransferase
MEEMKNLLEELGQQGVLRDPAVRRALQNVDRADFMPRFLKKRAYDNRPYPIGYGQTISQPYTVAFMLDLLHLPRGARVLDIGSGSGWTTALLAAAVGENGRVLGLERIPELVRFGRENLARYRFSHAAIELSGPELGRPGTQWDRILVSAAARVFPHELTSQLAEGGRLVIPVGSAIVAAELKPDGRIEEEEYYGFVFVPLIC